MPVAGKVRQSRGSAASDDVALHRPPIPRDACHRKRDDKLFGVRDSAAPRYTPLSHNFAARFTACGESLIHGIHMSRGLGEYSRVAR
jgi:hypothetical protein